MESLILQGLAAIGAATVVLVFNWWVKQICMKILNRRKIS